MQELKTKYKQAKSKLKDQNNNENQISTILYQTFNTDHEFLQLLDDNKDCLSLVFQSCSFSNTFDS